MKIEWINYKGMQILFSDYKGLSSEEMIKHLKKETQMILQQKEPILYMADFTSTIFTTEFMHAVNEDGKLTKRLVKKSALVGITGMKAVMLNTFNMITGIKARAFDNEYKAKDYLVN